MRTLNSLLSCLWLGVALPAGAAALDEHSYARHDQVRVSHLYLDLDADFGRKSLAGFAELTLQWRDPAARTLVLDTRDLAIARVLVRRGDGSWRTARWSLGAADPVKGSALTVAVPEQPGRVRVYYASAPGASGLQWLDPAQTLGKREPFMFSQSQAIHARSWVPLQDTPAVRFTYNARIDAPAGLRALMSADNDPAADGKGGFRFQMPQAIPSYLLAIAIGDNDFRAMGPRTGVYAEPGILDAAAREYADTERMIDAAEALYGPYRWGRYDLLVLPPSFPYGGMENPRLTFLTPTAIAGDKSLVSLIAHELAHSWSGNLVTNAAWRHMWLNEGFTNYVENRVVEAVYGSERAEMELAISQAELVAGDLRTLEPGLTVLVPDLRGRSPDDVFSEVPYIKGAWFLHTLETRVGRAAFDPFLRGWFDAHAFGSVDTDTFVRYLERHLLAQHPAAMGKQELAQWLHEPGLPPGTRATTSARLGAVDSASAQWLAGELAAADLPTAAWTTQEWLHFLNTLPPDLASARLAQLDQAWHLTRSGNSEIAFRWFMAGIRAGYEPARQALEAFLLQVGRRKFIVPLYQELAKRPADKAWAQAIYVRARPGYHPVSQHSVDAVLGRPG